MLEKFLTMRERYHELEQQMALPENSTNPKKMAKLGREYSKLGKLMPYLDDYEKVIENIVEDEKIIEDSKDSELCEIARTEMESLQERCDALEKKLLEGLMADDPNEGKNVIVELRAGTGGDEAGLFAGDLYRMYTRLAERKGWNIEIMSSNATNLGGFKEIIFIVEGDDAYNYFQYEGGVHRVQRVPQTETSGRIHTSAASVMVLPEAEKEDVEISSDELRIDYYAASGHGGQSVNRTYSAVRIVHLPTGIIATCQDEKSQHKNRDKAMRVLRARLNQKIEEEKQKELSSSRRNQVRSGDRSEKIRTYNFPQNRITDHRINFTAYNLTELLDGDVEDLHDALVNADIQKFLKTLSNNRVRKS